MNVSEFPREALGFEKMQILRFYGNKLKELPDNLQSCFANLNEVNISANPIGEWLSNKKIVPKSGLFPETLEVFISKLNSLGCVPPSLANLPSLVRVDLQYNQIKEIGKELNNCKQLDELLLNENNLEKIDKNFGKLNKALTKLELKSNNLGSIDLANLDSVQMIDLSHNKVSKFPKNFQKCKNLRHLNLSHNQIKSLPKKEKEINAENQLNKFILRNNRIDSLDKFPFSQFNALVELDLSSNGLSELPESISCLNSLNKLNVSCNKLSDISNIDWGGLSELKVLLLGSNKLKAVPSSISKISGLQNIFIGFNDALSDVSFAEELPQLKIFSAAGNSISSLNLKNWKSISSNSLTYLNLSHNLFESIPEGSNLLKWLDISFNKILNSKISDDSLFPKLYLDLRNSDNLPLSFQVPLYEFQEGEQTFKRKVLDNFPFFSTKENSKFQVNSFYLLYFFTLFDAGRNFGYSRN